MSAISDSSGLCVVMLPTSLYILVHLHLAASLSLSSSAQRSQTGDVLPASATTTMRTETDRASVLQTSLSSLADIN